MTVPSNAVSSADVDDPLIQWIGLEVRRARTAFEEGRKLKDAEMIALAGRDAGVRIKAVINIVDDVATALVAATVSRVSEYRSKPEAVEHARVRVAALVAEMVSHAELIAYSIKAGPAAHETIAARKNALQADIDNAFRLSVRHSAAPRPTPVAVTTIKKPRDAVGRGRRRGGGYAKKDVAVVEKIRLKVLAEDIFPYPAALHFVDEAEGSGSVEAKAKRLVARYYDQYPETKG